MTGLQLLMETHQCYETQVAAVCLLLMSAEQSLPAVVQLKMLGAHLLHAADLPDLDCSSEHESVSDWLAD